ncbi:MAG: imidazole glycerol phosphate synthase subunit HisH [Ignavibacteriales bacterium]|nr:imidazole glycerol phosphate synthase subunit HisH [Ignavibacteriales bacterium]
MIGIVDYGAGNVASVMYALEALGIEAVLSADPVVLSTADKIIFPGVGEASSAMAKLRLTGIDSFLTSYREPILGICLGMQLLAAFSEEGSTDCLSLINGTCRMFDKSLVKTPHIGWAQVQYNAGNALFEGIKQNDFFYYAHSYFLPEQEETIARSENSTIFSAAVNKGNVYGVQFHPEKSADAGLRLLKNFVQLHVNNREEQA